MSIKKKRSEILRESNIKALKRCISENSETRDFAQSFKERFQFDYLDESKFPFLENGFSLPKACKKIRESNKNMREADQSDGFLQLLRAGIMQGINNGMYENQTTIYKEICTIFPSTKDTELIAPVVGIGFPNEVAPGGKYPEVGMYASDKSLKARLFGAIFPISIFTEEDDQTKQLSLGAKMLGEYMDILIEVFMMAKLASVPKATGNMTYANFTAYPSETRESDEPSTWPYATAASPFLGGGYNRPSSFGAPTQANIESGYSALATQKNHLGIRMSVKPNVLLCGPKYIFDVAAVANSEFYSKNVYNTSGPDAAVGVAGPMVQNQLKGLFEPIQGNYLFDYDGSSTGLTKAWWLLDTSKPWFFLNMRNAPAVYTEASNSGKAFEQDLHRTKVNARFNGDVADGRFMWQGNNGSV